MTDMKRDSMKSYYTYSCWPNRYQEPYLLLRRNDSVALFNEILVNYGHNKITFIENLRFHGMFFLTLQAEYTFVLAGKVFAFDVPHSP